MGNQQPLHVKPTPLPPHYNLIYILLRYVGNLDYECTSEELYFFLSDFGEIDFVDLPL